MKMLEVGWLTPITALLVLLLQIDILVISHPLCTDFEFPTKVVAMDHDWFCPEYRGKGEATCCASIDDEAEAQRKWTEISNASPECKSLYRQVVCTECHPWSAHLYDTEESSANKRDSPLLCSDFCRSFYSACRFAVFHNAFGGDGRRPLSSIHIDENAFCGLHSSDYYCFPFNESIQQRAQSLTPAFIADADTDTVIGYSYMIDMQFHDDRTYVVSKNGKIRTFLTAEPNGTITKFLDITDKVLNSGEQGLLGLAFDPDFTSNLYFYVNYISSTTADTVISRFRANTRLRADESSELVFMNVVQPYGNHNGGWMGFSPLDSLLYISLGDGGAGGDPLGHGQNTNSLLGKMLRVDIRSLSPTSSYTIPSDNPFADGTNGRPEIYAWGLRNAWRCSFDLAPPHELYCGDVGQGRYEEVSVIDIGNNYGWRVLEGKACLFGGGDPLTGACDGSGMTAPIFQYGRTGDGSGIYGRSITGGYVYRGAEARYLQGSYIFADFASQLIFMLRPTKGLNGREWEASVLTQTAYQIGSFAQDPASGEVYVLPFSTGRAPILALSSRDNPLSVQPDVDQPILSFNPDIDDDYAKFHEDTSKSSEPSGTSRNGWGTGAIAGLVVGIVTLLILVVVVAVVLKHRKNSSTQPTAVSSAMSYKLEQPHPPVALADENTARQDTEV